jgi:hypothetical protein
MIAKLSEEFEARNCKLLAISIGSISGHRSFIKETQVLRYQILLCLHVRFLFVSANRNRIAVACAVTGVANLQGEVSFDCRYISSNISSSRPHQVCLAFANSLIKFTVCTLS